MNDIALQISKDSEMNKFLVLSAADVKPDEFKIICRLLEIVKDG